jgi:peptidyl-prolyl cis-trans isomerase C
MSLSIDASVSRPTDAGAPAVRPRNFRLFWRRLGREPFLQFIVLGALIFAVAHVAQRERATSQRRIVVDERLRQRIVQTSQTQSGITPSPEQLERLIGDYIDEQVMYREALRMGLDQDDEIIRRRLIQKMQFLQRDLATVPPPGESELRAYYGAHPELFTSASGVSFDQLYFSADQGGWTKAEGRARGALDQVRQRSTRSPAPQDDSFPFQIPVEDLTHLDAVRIFGDTGIVEALFSTPEGQWSEPVRSAYGWHLIRVNHRQEANVAAFSQVRTQVESAYLQDQTQAAQRRELAALRAHYDIVRPADTDGSGSAQ